MALQVFLGEQIRTFVKRNNLSQTKAAAFFGIQQPKISKIMGDDLDGMSIDYLLRIVAKTVGRLNYLFRQPRKLSRKEVEARIETA